MRCLPLQFAPRWPRAPLRRTRLRVGSSSSSSFSRLPMLSSGPPTSSRAACCTKALGLRASSISSSWMRHRPVRRWQRQLSHRRPLLPRHRRACTTSPSKTGMHMKNAASRNKAPATPAASTASIVFTSRSGSRSSSGSGAATVEVTHVVSAPGTRSPAALVSSAAQGTHAFMYTRSFTPHAQVVSPPDASSRPSGLVEFPAHGTHAFLSTRSFDPQTVAAHAVSSPRLSSPAPLVVPGAHGTHA